MFIAYLRKANRQRQMLVGRKMYLLGIIYKANMPVYYSTVFAVV